MERGTHLDCFRGMMLAVPLGLAIWAVIIAAIIRVVG